MKRKSIVGVIRKTSEDYAARNRGTSTSRTSKGGRKRLADVLKQKRSTPGSKALLKSDIKGNR